MSYASFIESYEGRARFVYKCSADKYTIGVGRNLEDRGLSDDEIDYLLKNDVTYAVKQAKDLVRNFRVLSDRRQEVIVSMIFQLGSTGFKNFRQTIAYIEASKFDQAATEMLDSKWYKKDTPARAKAHSEQMRIG